ncbi:MAG: hypothetical protein JXA82_01495 [Sedimentisphaerales bacterium]|nr:hypothetical protein [Sedimentisphaerales bacterium]
MGIYQSLLNKIADSKTIRGWIPESIKRICRGRLGTDAYRRRMWRAGNEFADIERTSSYPATINVRLGIIEDITQQHKHYIAACRDLQVPYRLLDITGPDWLDEVRNAGVDAFLVWPSVYITVWKQMFDERLKIIHELYGDVIYPNYEALWLYESKRRVKYWLDKNGFPHPRTWIFYDMDQAICFSQKAMLPIVYKTDLGGTVSGVRIFRNRNQLQRFIRKCFQKGFIRQNGDSRDRQWGSVLLQEYLPDIREWRMIRVGDSYFGYEKLKRGDFHSGSHAWRHGRPPELLLNITKEVTEKGQFRTMDLDIFLTGDQTFYINELQAVFGMGNPYEMCIVDEKPGRMIINERNQWVFEEGSFCDNYLCNLRVEDVLNILGLSYREL